MADSQIPYDLLPARIDNGKWPEGRMQEKVPRFAVLSFQFSIPSSPFCRASAAMMVWTEL
jgi:hypothetical protein